MTSLSVIIVTYNNADTIGACLKSFHSYLPSDIKAQVILIDNNSHDETVEKIKQNYIISLSSIKHELLINKVNRGFAPAVNQGMRIADGEYILILNPDTEITRGMVSTLICCLNSKIEIGLVSPQFRYPDGTVQPSCRRFPSYWTVIWELTGLSRFFPHNSVFSGWKMGDFDYLSTREVDQPMGACLFTTREAVKKVGEMDEQFPMFFNDVDWCRRFREKGYKNIFVSDTYLIHKGGHSVYQRRARMILSSHWSFIRYFNKHRRKWWERICNLALIPFLMTAAGFRIMLWILHPVRKK